MKKLFLIGMISIVALMTSAQGFDDLPTPVEEKVIDYTPDSIA